MIYTCTVNPSLDYYLSLDDDIRNGSVSRSNNEKFDCGGKGINVSIVLSNLGINSNCLGFLGGFTKEIYIDLLSKYPCIQPLFTSITETTRINVKLLGSNETSINAKGPNISEKEFDKFKNRVTSIYDDDFFVLSGNIQDELKERIIEICKELTEDGIRVVLDCTEDVIDKCLELKPFFANVTHLISYDDNESAIKEKLLNLNKNGVRNCVVCKRSEPSYFCSDGKVYKCEATDNDYYVTGYFDSLIAGFLFNTIRGGNAVEAFMYGEAASLATSMSNDLAEKDKIEECYKDIKIIEI